GVTASYGPFSYHHARINGIDPDLSRSKFLCQSARDRIDCALGGVINYASWRSQGAGKRTNINDASAICAEVLECFLSGEQDPENVSIKHPVKLLLRGFV